MNSEQRKEYNQKYYSENKQKILLTLSEKKKCPLCDKYIAHQNLYKHQQRSYCITRREIKKINDEINNKKDEMVT